MNENSLNFPYIFASCMKTIIATRMLRGENEKKST